MGKSAAPLTLILVLLAASSLISDRPVSGAEATAENTWTARAPIPEELGGNTAALANGKIYLMGRRYALGPYNYEYDPETDSWATKTLMPTPRSISGIVAFQNKIYTMGGSIGWTQENGTIYSCANEVYNPATDTWETKAPIPENQTGRIMTSVLYGQIHLMGINSHYVYDVATDSWTLKNPPPLKFEYSFGPVVLDNKIYIFEKNLTQIYNPKNDSWSSGTPPPAYNAFAGACATTGVRAPKRIYVFGGSPSPFDALGTTQVYDPYSDTWKLGKPMPTSRGGAATAAVNDQIYVMGGSQNMYYGSSANELYTPFGYGTPDPSYTPPDNTVPEVSVLSPENKVYYTPEIQLSFTVNEPDLWMRYSLDNENITEISGNSTITGLPLGLHNLTVYVTDETGNTRASQTIHFKVEDFFPKIVVLTAVITACVIGIGLVVYFKKRKQSTSIQ